MSATRASLNAVPQRAQAMLFGDPLPDLDANSGYRGPIACRVAGITYRQLDYWARTGLVEPTVRGARGSGPVAHEARPGTAGAWWPPAVRRAASELLVGEPPLGIVGGKDVQVDIALLEGDVQLAHEQTLSRGRDRSQPVRGFEDPGLTPGEIVGASGRIAAWSSSSGSGIIHRLRRAWSPGGSRTAHPRPC